MLELCLEEAQQIRLATQIGSNLSGVLYILDEPSIGLHQRDNDRLLDSLRKMRDLEYLIVVEHDRYDARGVPLISVLCGSTWRRSRCIWYPTRSQRKSELLNRSVSIW